MAVFGAPMAQDDHANRGLRAAREMLRKLGGFNEWTSASESVRGFRMGIRLSSGPVMAGNVGCERRVEYTAIGDTTNIASRLEGMTKSSPFELLIADSTRAALSQDFGDLIYVDTLEVPGKLATIAIWSFDEARRDATRRDATTANTRPGRRRSR